MSAATISPIYLRPFNPDIKIVDIRSFFRSIAFSWWLIRLPIFCLGVPSSYGVFAFTAQRYPTPIAMIAGAGYELAFIGAMAYADQQYDTDILSAVLWYVMVIGAVFTSAMINVLFSAGGEFSHIVAEDYVHGVPLAVVNFFYTLTLHRNSAKALAIAETRHAAAKALAEEAQRKADLKAEQERLKAEEQERLTRHKCPRCGAGFETPQKRSGHMRHCRPSPGRFQQ